MFLMYVDESGDCGLPSAGSPTTLFCLAGVVVHELAWHDTINQLLQFRRWLRRKHGIPQEAELHTAEMISKPKKLHASIQTLSKHVRLAVIRNFADEIARLRDVNVISIVLDKSPGVATPEDVFNYIYAIFHSPTYRSRYAEFLKIDFPRVPLTSDGSSTEVIYVTMCCLYIPPLQFQSCPPLIPYNHPSAF